MVNNVFQGYALGNTNSANYIDTTLLSNPSSSFSMSPSLVNGLISAGTSTVNGIMDWINAGQQRRWSEKMMDKQNAWSLDMWNLTNEYNSPSAQVQRLRDAGLNPLYYGLDGSSANSFESAQPMQYERASAPLIGNPIEGMQDVMQLESAKAQIAQTEAQTAKIKSETGQIELDLQFAKDSYDTRQEQLRESLALTKEQKATIIKQREEICQNIRLKAEQEHTEVVKQSLLRAEEVLRRAEASEIYVLLDSKKSLLDAQTFAQKCSGYASYYNAMYQKGLIDSGYIDKLTSEVEHRISLLKTQEDKAKAEAFLTSWKANVRSGNIWTEEMYEQANELEKFLMGSFEGIFNVASIITESVAGPLSGLVK